MRNRLSYPVPVWCAHRGAPCRCRGARGPLFEQHLQLDAGLARAIDRRPIQLPDRAIEAAVDDSLVGEIGAEQGDLPPSVARRSKAQAGVHETVVTGFVVVAQTQRLRMVERVG